MSLVPRDNGTISRVSTGPITDDVRNAALDRLRNGEKVTDVARAIGVNKATVSRWASKAGVHVVTEGRTANATRAAQTKWAERRGQLMDRYGDVIESLLDRLKDAPAKDVRDYVWSAAVLTDKAELLSGRPTQRHEVRDLERRRDRVTAMADELEERRRAKAG